MSFTELTCIREDDTDRWPPHLPIRYVPATDSTDPLSRSAGTALPLPEPGLVAPTVAHWLVAAMVHEDSGLWVPEWRQAELRCMLEDVLVLTIEEALFPHGLPLYALDDAQAREWHQRRVPALLNALWIRMNTEPRFCEALTRTSGKVLVETGGGRFWGCERVPDDAGGWCWVGANVMGQALMAARAALAVKAEMMEGADVDVDADVEALDVGNVAQRRRNRRGRGHRRARQTQ